MYYAGLSAMHRCTASTDDVTITFHNNPTAANAGPDQTGLCGVTSGNFSSKYTNSRNRSMYRWSRRSGNLPIKSNLSIYRNIRNNIRITLDYQQCTMYSKYR
ncbi:MAG: hypothetical protein IPO70_15725, partial [Bacteroidetes bacterium]|nr:hypothetical protein [Bacteroidota bacterium]